MKVKDFNIEKYVESYILCGRDERELSQEKYDDYLKKKDSMEKNVRNLLKYFSVNQREGGFSFDKKVLGYFPLAKFDSKDISNL